jgi:small conductance mechanosensitive channel
MRITIAAARSCHPGEPMLLPVATSAADELELTSACGPPGHRPWVCTTVFDITGSGRAAQLANDAFRILVIVVVAYVVVRISRLIIRRIVARLSRDEAAEKIEKIRRRTGVALLDTSPVPNVRRALRAQTIGAVIRSIVAALIWATAFVMILDTLDVNLAAIGIGASIIGVAVGFGSQSLVKDFVTGIFMLVEDQYGVGDVIDTGVAAGTVEGVSLRTTRLRDAEGVVWHVPNGSILRVGNKSQQWARAILDVPVSYDADLRVASEAIRGAARAVATDPEFERYVIDEPEVLGVEQVTNDQVIIRLGVKTQPLEQWRIARELRRRVKESLDAVGVHPLGDSIVTYRAQGGPPPGADAG